MTILYLIFIIVFCALSVFSYRQGIKDSYFLKNNIPFKNKKEEKESGILKDYSKLMNYDFDKAGES